MTLSYQLAELLLGNKTSVDEVVAILNKYKMLSLLPSIEKALIQLSLRETSRDTIMIESPFPLSDVAITKIRQLIGNDISHHEVVINKNILAGFKAKCNGKLYDGSAQRIIKQITR